MLTKTEALNIGNDYELKVIEFLKQKFNSYNIIKIEHTSLISDFSPYDILFVYEDKFGIINEFKIEVKKRMNNKYNLEYYQKNDLMVDASKYKKIGEYLLITIVLNNQGQEVVLAGKIDSKCNTKNIKTKLHSWDLKYGEKEMQFTKPKNMGLL